MAKPNVTPTREYLCEVFDYDEWTGELTWKRPTSSRIRIGSPVGTINVSGYVGVKLNGGRYSAHRLIYKMMMGEEPQEVDHINNNRSDNRWCNLRSVTRQENQLNRIDTKRNGGQKHYRDEQGKLHYTQYGLQCSRENRRKIKSPED